jgi:N-acetylmuramoyl-L-alanine amidase
MKIFIDNGHGLMTAGKRSPDGQFREPFYNREIARRVVSDLRDRGLDAELLVPEDDDISLSERVRRINASCFLLGKQNVILVSIHVNAAGNGSKWLNATGWSVYTCKGRTASDKLAECLCESAIKNFPGRRIRMDMSDGDMDWEENFYLLRKSLCPAVLTENFFMDSKKDLAFLQSVEGKRDVVITHVEGIVEYLNTILL